MATTAQEQQTTKTILPPGPPRLPYIGNMLSLRQDPLGFMQQLQRTYGNMATIYIGKNHAVQLLCAEHLRYWLVEQPRDVTKPADFRDNNAATNHAGGLCG